MHSDIAEKFPSKLHFKHFSTYYIIFFLNIKTTTSAKTNYNSVSRWWVQRQVHSPGHLPKIMPHQLHRL